MQPDILINNRTGDGGDYDTPEQRIGGFQHGSPWESCMTISAHNQWAWGGPNDGVKPLAACLLMLIRCAGGDGNVLLNIGPEPTGAIEDCQVERLKEIGAWLAKYGQSIYGTRGGPYKPTKRVASTRKGNTVYLHILGLAGRDAEASRPAREDRQEQPAHRRPGHGSARPMPALKLPCRSPTGRTIDTIVALAARQAGASRSRRSPSPAWADSLTDGQERQGLQRLPRTWRSMRAKWPSTTTTTTRWATDAATGQCWLEVDLGKPQTFDRAMIDECVDYGVRVKAFELQYQEGNDWKTFFKGKTIGKNREVKFAPVTARHVRLNIDGREAVRPSTSFSCSRRPAANRRREIDERMGHQPPRFY